MNDNDIQLEREPKTAEPAAPAPPAYDKVISSMVRAWKELPAITRDQFNEFTKKTYANMDSVLETIKPVLAKHGLMISQPPVLTGTHVRMVLSLWHESGQIYSFPEIEIPLGKHGIQDIGTVITYSRRYQACSCLGLSTGEDDDGNSAQHQHQNAHEKPQGQRSKGGSTLKQRVAKPEQRINEAFGEDRAIKMLGFAQGKGVTEEQVRAEVARLTDKKQSEQDIGEWPYALAGKITEFIKKNAVPELKEG